MGGWRIKFIFLLIVYFAGFATAVYCLSPVSERAGLEDNERSFVYSILKSDEFAQSFNDGIHKCIDFSKTAANSAGKLIRDSYDNRFQTDG